MKVKNAIKQQIASEKPSHKPKQNDSQNHIHEIRTENLIINLAQHKCEKINFETLSQNRGQVSKISVISQHSTTLIHI